MATNGKRWSKARLSCPRPEHAGSRVRLDGRYGKPGHRRQLYRCLPANGDRPHRFTELLPREEAWRDACETCERPVHFNEGPHAARRYQFVARGIAEALVAVGAGASYRQAGLVARERAQRRRVDPETGEPRPTRHGQLVADWVEVFAPVVFEPHRPAAWPEAGSLLLDDLPFSVRDPATGRFRIAFRVFCAAGFERGRPKLWRVEAFPDASQANWEAFLGALEGAPRRVVCDNHSGLNGAVRAAFPDAELYLCEWHLRHALERLMAKIRKGDEHRDAIDALLARVEAAFTGPAFWKPFLATPTPPRSRASPSGSTVPDGSSPISSLAAVCAASDPPIRRSRPRRWTASSSRSEPRSTPAATGSRTASAPTGCSC